MSITINKMEKFTLKNTKLTGSPLFDESGPIMLNTTKDLAGEIFQEIKYDQILRKKFFRCIAFKDRTDLLEFVTLIGDQISICKGAISAARVDRLREYLRMYGLLVSPKIISRLLEYATSKSSMACIDYLKSIG